QLAQPCRVRYRRRAAPRPAVAADAIAVRAAGRAGAGAADPAGAAADGRWRVAVDLDLCPGHGVCANEAPAVFRVDPEEAKVALLDPCPPEALRPQVEAAVAHCPTRALRIDP